MTNWQTKTIKDTTVLIKDGTHGTHKDVEGGIALLSAKDIDGGKVNVAPDARVISEADFNAIHARYSLKDGDILLTIVGSLGRVAIVTDYANNYTFQRSVAILRFNNEVATSYAYYYLTSAVFQKELLKRESKGAQGGVYLGDISKIKIHIPEKPEQERIVGVLEVWDEYIEKLEQKIALKEQLKKGLMQQLLTGKRRLPGFSKKWSKVRYGDLCKFQSGFAFSSSDFSSTSGLRLIRNRDLKGGGGGLFYSGDSVPESYIVSNGDILIGMDGDFIAHRWTEGEALLNQRVGRLIDFNNSDPDFIFYRSQQDLAQIENETSSTTVKHLSAKEFEKRLIEVPHYDEQVAIGTLLGLYDEHVGLLKYKKENALEQKKYLLKNLITGAIRTPEDLQPLDTSRLERSAL